MAESPDHDDTDEALFLDKEFLSMLNPRPLRSTYQNALKDINDKLVEQLEEKERTKSRYKILKEKIKAASKRNEEFKLKIAALKEERNASEKVLEKLNSQEDKDLHRYECMLYYSITKIKWDMDCPENEIAGVTGGKNITTFHLDSTKHSKSFITNHLWSLIENSADL